MQNAGHQFGHGGAPSHQGATYGHSESSTPSGGSTTSSLRQFRKKDVDKQQVNDTGPIVADSHVARVAPHNHYPPRPQDCFRYPTQFPDYSLPNQVKYSEISDHQPLQEQISPTVIQKAKGKEYIEMCNVSQPHMKQSYTDHLSNQQPYANDPNLHPHHAQYLQKDPQVHPSYKPESQYYPKENQYQQLPHQMQKYNMPPQVRKYQTDNDFLSKLRRIHPTMARSIMSDHHLQESQTTYQAMDQTRMYPHQNQRYVNYPSPMQNNPYPHGYMPPQPYPNYPSSCSYTRAPQMPPRFPSTNPHERSISPRRSYTENLPIPPINYAAIPQRISPSYPQYNPPDYAQHYQHRRGPVPPQEYYPQPCRTAQYLPHQMAQQEMTENRVTVSDSIKQYIENWADEETASEMNQIENNRLCKENMRVREEPSTETVYMINASELQYLENGIPLVTSENGIPLVASENGQYYLKSGVTIDNSTGMVRIVEKTNQVEPSEGTVDRVVNLHIVDPLKPDCMMASKPNELNQRQNESSCNMNQKSRVVIHQNTVIQPGQTTIVEDDQQYQTKVGTSLPVLVENEVTPEVNNLENLANKVFKECKKETVDKNCSPINMEQLEKMDDFNDSISVICPLKLLGQEDEIKEENSNVDSKLKNMPIIDLLPESLQNVPEENNTKDEEAPSIFENQTQDKPESCNTTGDIRKETDMKLKENDLSINKIDNETNDCVENNKDEVEELKNIATGLMHIKEVINREAESQVHEINKVVLPVTDQETKEDTVTDYTKDITNVELFPEDNIKDEGMLKSCVSEYENEAPNAINLENIMSSNNIRETEMSTEDCGIVDENKTVIVPTSSCTNDTDKAFENETTVIPKAPEDAPKDHIIETSCAEDVSKCTVKRTKRIFSVDDIINNIGNNTSKPKPDTLLSERRRSLQITREFLEREIDTSYLFLRKMLVDEPCSDATEEKQAETKDTIIFEQHIERTELIPKEESVEHIDENQGIKENEEVSPINMEHVKIDENNVEESVGMTDKELSSKDPLPVDEKAELTNVTETEVIEKVKVVDIIENEVVKNEANEKIREENPTTDQKLDGTKAMEFDEIEESSGRHITASENEYEKLDESEPKKEEPTTKQNIYPTKTKEDQDSTAFENEVVGNSSNALEEQEVTLDKTDTCDNSADVPDLNIKESTSDTTSQNEVQYRNAIRVEENNVLLEIAGELVEISVNLINGKKVITVLPLSESTVVDFNDNYETLDTTQLHDPSKANALDDVHNLEASQTFPVEEAAGPDIIESTSEIIIGMDISLEEEIQLDLEKPQSFCTKAAKKSYDNDLQIPSITTSEDITDNSKANSYSPNDKVSSSKEQKPEKSKGEKKKTTKSNDALGKNTLKKKLKHSDGHKSVVKELMVRKVKKEMSQQSKEEAVEEEEDFIPFKDLIKARKLKKMKLQQLKADDNVSADSTNRLDQEEISETDFEAKLEEAIAKSEELKDKDPSKEEETIESIADLVKDEIEVMLEESKSKNSSKDYPIVSNIQKSLTAEEKWKYKEQDEQDSKTKETVEKVAKKVTFGHVSYEGPEKNAEQSSSMNRCYKLEDPRLKSRTNGGILVPSVSELMRENEGLPNNKKKLSLAEYNNRKRKLSYNNDDKDSKVRKTNPDPEIRHAEPITLKIDMKRPKEEPSIRFKLQRPKSLDDIKIFGKPKDATLVKRKFSLEVTSSKPNCFDWEETQSPKTHSSCLEDPQKRLSEFRGLINNNKSKVVVGLGDPKPASMENSQDEILQNYKEQVDSKLSTLNLQIPRLTKPTPNVVNPFNTETITLMQRFLKNEKLTAEEMEKIRKIISYKRLMQQLDKIKSPGLNSPLNPSYEIRKSCTEKEMKLHLKKVPEKKKKRFRNLYTDSTSESDSDFGEEKRSNADYSVVQSNCYAAGVPKLIIKRKTEVPVPVVRLERLDLKILANRKRRFC